MTSTPDARLFDAHDLALAALREITPPSTVGDAVGHIVEDDGVVSLRFANRMAGYPGWFWTVSIAAASPDAAPTVLEVELLPGDGSLTAPDWVPWAERLADYQAAQIALAEAAVGELDEDDVDDLDDEDDDDEDEDDEDSDLVPDDLPVLHAGDVDGVDIDELDADADEDDVDELVAGSAEDDDDADDETADPDADRSGGGQPSA